MRSKLKTDGRQGQSCHRKTSMRLWGWKIFLVLFTMQGLSLSALLAQNTRVSLNLKDAPITNVFQEIKLQTKMTIVYNISDVDPNQKVNIEASNEAVSTVLDRLLANTDLAYSMEGNYIVFAKKGASTTVQGSTDPITVKGSVVDKNGEPLIGASIVVKGTNNAAIADMEGKFTLNVEPGRVLVISFIGYTTKEITLGYQTNYNVVLEDSATALDEVVVTALGIKRSEKALSYPVQTVKAEELTTVKNTNVMNSLAGKVAGLTVASSSSGLGGATRVIMRGSKSIEGSSNALYVIDGIPMNNFGGGGGTQFTSTGATEAIADINPEDIESVSVLTGAAAAALYGYQGANGAIVITTKKGSADKLEINFSSSIEMLSSFVTPEFQNRYGTGSSDNSRVKSWGAKLVSENNYGYDPTADFFQLGTVFSNNVSVATGNTKNQTYFSASAVNGTGIIPNNQYDRYNFTFRNTAKFLNDRMTLDVGANYIIQKDQNMRNQGVYSSSVASAYLFPRGNDFDMARAFERYDPVRGINVQFWDEFVGGGDYNMQNPYWAAYRNLVNNDKKRYMLNAGLSYEILSWLNVSGRIRVDNSSTDNMTKLYASSDLTIAGENGTMGIGKINNRQTYGDVLVNINKPINDDFGLVVNVGANINDVKYDDLTVSGPIRSDGIPNVFNVRQLDLDKRAEATNVTRRQTQAVFGSAELSYKSTYYLTITGRNDWDSSLAGSEQTSFFYPSVGLSTVLTEALSLPKQIQYLKVRGSFTQVGNAIPIYISIPTYEWNGGAWSTKSIYPIRRFKPELTTSWEFGLNARFLDHFNVDFSWYYADSKNQTFNPGLTPSSGYSYMYVQTGNIRNTGIEASLGYFNKWNDFEWKTNFVFSANRNKIEDLITNLVLDNGQVLNSDELDPNKRLGRCDFILKKGGTLGDLYTIGDLVRDGNGKIYVDAEGYPQATIVDEKIFLGSVFPKANLSWRNDFSWRNINLGVLFTARLGGVVYSQTQATLDAYGVSEASAAARDAGGVIINGGDLMDAEKWYSTIAATGNILPQFYMYSATNMRLQELSLSYTLPRKWLKNTADITVSMVAHNLWMIYCKAPFDPETTASTTENYYQGMDYFMTPSLRSIGFSLKVKF
jgi:TonB-linked SusC/RagA family outer membrane protein